MVRRLGLHHAPDFRFRGNDEFSRGVLFIPMLYVLVQGLANKFGGKTKAPAPAESVAH